MKRETEIELPPEEATEEQINGTHYIMTWQPTDSSGRM